MRQKQPTTPTPATRVAGLASMLLAIVVAPARSQEVEPGAAPSTDTPPPPAVARFDPSAMPEPTLPTEGLGLRYASLSPQETRPLRRGFKLPMEALATADSVRSLRKAVRVAPLPDPSQPFLAVKPLAGETVTNPFTGSQVTSFRLDPMRALGEMLGAVEGGESLVDTAPATDDPFASPADSADGAAAEVSESPADEATADPFGSDDFGEDPFGF